MPLRDECCDLARKLDWSFSYADERQQLQADVVVERHGGTCSQLTFEEEPA